MIYPDGTRELSPARAKRWFWRLGWWALCWLTFRPHLITVDNTGQEWFRRWWLLGGPGFSFYLHRYLHGEPEASAFGMHHHPRNVISLVLWGGYRESVLGACQVDFLRFDDVIMDGCLDDKPVGITYEKGPDGERRALRHKAFVRSQWVLPFRPRRLRWDEAHEVKEMTPRTWSLFLMWGKNYGWQFIGKASKGSSRILQEAE